MTQKDKELLLKDLCARLPCGVMVYDYDREETREMGLGTLHDIIINDLECKPYLRPMSSMTEEEKKEYAKVVVKSQDCSYKNNESATTMVNDWYLSKGFDVRGLIPKGLALEAPEGMYNIKEK